MVSARHLTLKITQGGYKSTSLFRESLNLGYNKQSGRGTFES